MMEEEFNFCERKRRERGRIKTTHFNLQILPFLFFIICSIIIGTNQTSSKIKLIIEGNENPQLLHNSFYTNPSKVFVNGFERSDCSKTCNLQAGQNNEVILQFDFQLTSWENMFQYLNKIKEVDLSLCDASQVNSMVQMFQGCTGLQKVLFGNIDVSSITSMFFAFENCNSLVSLDFSNMVFSNLRIMLRTFQGCSNLEEINLKNIKLTSLTDMGSAFQGCSSLKSIDFSDLDFPALTSAYGLFLDCSSLHDINFGNINTPSLKTTAVMFQGCTSLISVDISHFDFSNVEDMNFMFLNCHNLQTVEFGNIETSSLNTMNELFRFCYSLQSVDLSNFDTTKVKSMKNVFEMCSSLESLSLWKTQTTSLESMSSIFSGCSQLTTVDLSTFDTDKVEDFSFVFNGCSRLTSLDVSNFDVSKGKTMESMFDGCSGLKNISMWNTQTNSLEKIYKLFNGCSSLTSVDLSSFVTDKVEDFSFVFNGCSSLTSLDMSNFDVSNVKYMESMFEWCSSLRNILFWSTQTSSLENMKRLFFSCSSLISLDLSSFVTSKINDLAHTFFDCRNLESLDLSHFDTSKVITMNSMFYNCEKLKDLNLHNLDTSSVEDMTCIFQQCRSLETLDLSSFNTQKVRNMRLMFFQCTSLKSLDVSNFDTSNVEDMFQMFFECMNLISLNLANFQTTKVGTVNHMFSGSSSLKYLNLYLFELGPPVDITNIFERLRNDVIYCINDQNTINYILPSEKHKYVFCSDDCYFLNDDYKIDFNDKKCLESCSNSENNKLEYHNECLNTCPAYTLLHNSLCIDHDCSKYEEYSIQCQDGQPLGYYLDSNQVYKKCYELCSSCYGDGNSENHNCIECISGYRKLNDFENDNNCYLACTHYYYYDDSNVYRCTDSEACPTPYEILIPEKRKCIDQCEKDNIYKYEYHHSCLSYIVNETTYLENHVDTTHLENVVPSTTYKENIESISTQKENAPPVTTNIENNNPQTTHLDNNNPQTTNIDNKYPETTYINSIKPELSTIISETTELAEQKPKEELFDCLNQNKLINKCNTKENYNNTIKYDIITSSILSAYSPNSLKSLVIEGEGGKLYQITNVRNELELLNSDNIPEDYNLPILDLGECEALLKKKYNIDEKDSLIIIKQESLADKSSEKNIEYEIFEPYNKTKLNLSICSDIDINMYVKLELSEETKRLAEELEALGYNIFDINDRFYTDYCAPYTSPDKTDMLLSDRINYIYNNLDAQCQSNCYFSNYVSEARYINCTCNVEKEKEKEVKYIDKLNSKTFLQSFYYVLKYSNYKILKCYKLVFVSTVLTKNKGSIFIFILFILYCICLLVYMKKGIKPLQDNMKDILKDFMNEEGRLYTYKSTKSTLFFPPQRNLRSSLKGKGKEKKEKEKRVKESAKSLTGFNVDHIKKIDQKGQPKIESKSQLFKEKGRQYSSSKEILHSHRSSTKERKSKFRNRDTRIDIPTEEKQTKTNFDDFELNDLPYEEAVKYDKRSWIKIYWAILKREHIIIFTFFICHDYNMFVVKMSRFIFLLATDMAMNVFFFSDSTMHKIFLDYGKYDFVQQIPQVLYSSIVSQLLDILLCFLSLTDSLVYEIKNLDITKKSRKVIVDIFKSMKRKLFFYWLLTFIFFLGYWYVVACFCAVYPNTQIIFIKDSLLSFVVNLLNPFIIYSIPSAFRKCSLKCKNNNCLYKFSEIIPFF